MSINIIFKREGWSPVVEDDGQQLILHVPIESGFLGFSKSFIINHQDLKILQNNDERYYFLFAYIHYKYQMHPKSSLLRDDDVGFILHEVETDVEALLTKADNLSNGAVSNLIRICMGRDQKLMRNGKWFLRE